MTVPKRPWLMMCAGLGAAAIVGLSGCQQRLSSSGAAPAATCVPASWDDRCQVCSAGFCCAQSLACETDANPNCRAYGTCVSACTAGDADCPARCERDHPGGRAPYDGLEACRASSCDMCAQPASAPPTCGTAQGTCDRCMAERCCVPKTACQDNETCRFYEACLVECGAEARCPDRCDVDYTQGIVPYGLVELCMRDQCATECNL